MKDHIYVRTVIMRADTHSNWSDIFAYTRVTPFHIFHLIHTHKKKLFLLNNLWEYFKLNFCWYSGEKPYEYPTCKKGFSQSNSLKVHMNAHHGSPNQPGQSSPKNKSAKSPMPSASSSECPPLVTAESRKCLSPVEAGQLLETPAKIPKSTYYSSSENAYYSNENYLKALNAGGPADTADTTDELASRLSSMQNEMNSTDLKEVFTCNECSMKFTNLDLLNEHGPNTQVNHLLIHLLFYQVKFICFEGERPFKCELWFGRKFALRAHTLSHSTDHSEKLKIKLKHINETTAIATSVLIQSSRLSGQMDMEEPIESALSTDSTEIMTNQTDDCLILDDDQQPNANNLPVAIQVDCIQAPPVVDEFITLEAWPDNLDTTILPPPKSDKEKVDQTRANETNKT